MYTSNTGVDVKTKFLAKWIVKKWCWQVRVPRRKTQTCSLWWWNIWQKQCNRGKVYFAIHFREVTPPWRDRHGATTLFTSWWARKQKGDAVTLGILFFFSFYSTQDPSPWTVSPIILPQLIISVNRCPQRCASSVHQEIPSLDVKGYLMGWLQALTWRFIMVDRCLRPLTVFWSLPFND